MPKFGFKHSEESKAKMSRSRVGQVTSLETRQKLSISKQGSKNPMFGKSGFASPTFGRRLPQEMINKMRERATGKEFTIATRLQMSLSHKGKRHTAKAIEKCRISKLGDKNPSWRGGIAEQPYADSFTRQLRLQIKKRDRNTCQLCGKKRTEDKSPLEVHHIDYNKRNSDPINLIILCQRCHKRTNFNRQHWTSVFQNRAIAITTQATLHRWQMFNISESQL